MAVNTTFSLNFVQNLDLTQGPSDSNPNAIGLADGGFAVVGDHVGHTDLDTFDAVAGDTGGNNVFGFSDATIAQLTNGNLVLAGNDANSTVFTITSSTGSVISTVDIGDVDQTEVDVAALTGGRFVIVAQDEIGAVGGDADIDVFIRNADGTAFTSFTIDSSGDRDLKPKVVGLDDGGFAVAYTKVVGAETEVWRAVYNADGSVRSAFALVDTIGTVNRDVDITVMNGGFGIVYEDNGWGNTEITIARFNSAGSFLGFTNATNNGATLDSNATAIRLSNGMLVVASSADIGDNDIQIRLFDASGTTLLATRTVTGGESLFDEQNFPTLAGAAFGRIATFFANSTDGDVDGELLQGVRTAVSDGASDIMFGDDFVDFMTGNGGDDIMIAGGNNDSLNGNDGNDTLNGGAGVDVQNGGADSDTFVLNTGDLENPGETINGGTGSDRLLVQSNSSIKLATVSSIEEIEFSGAGAITTAMNGVQLGGGALSGNLLVDGRVGARDIIRVDMGTDTAVNLSGWVFQDWTPGGPDNDRVLINGDGDVDTIVGSSVRDDIKGGGNNDTLNGGLGSDFLTGGGGADRFIFNTAIGASNIDRIIDFAVNVDEIRLENTIFTGLPAVGNLNINAFALGASAGDASDRIIYNAANGALFYDQDGLGGVAQIRIATLATGLALDNLDFFVT